MCDIMTSIIDQVMASYGTVATEAVPLAGNQYRDEASKGGMERHSRPSVRLVIHSRPKVRLIVHSRLTFKPFILVME